MKSILKQAVALPLIAAAVFVAAASLPAARVELARAQSSPATEFLAGSGTVNLNNTGQQDLYEHVGTRFAPTRFVIRRASGAVAAEGSTTSLFISDTGDAFTSVTIPISAFDEPQVIYVHNINGRVSGLLINDRIRARPDAAHGDASVLHVDIYGVPL